MVPFIELSRTYFETPVPIEEQESYQESDPASNHLQQHSISSHLTGGLNHLPDLIGRQQKLEIVSPSSSNSEQQQQQAALSSGRHTVLWVANGCLCRLLLRNDWSEVKQICRLPTSQQLGKNQKTNTKNQGFVFYYIYTHTDFVLLSCCHLV